jgi:hypothetical protein
VQGLDSGLADVLPDFQLTEAAHVKAAGAAPAIEVVDLLRLDVVGRGRAGKAARQLLLEEQIVAGALRRIAS